MDGNESHEFCFAFEARDVKASCVPELYSLRARAAFSRDRYFEPAIENTIPDPNPNPNPNLRGYPRIEIPAHRITGI